MPKTKSTKHQNDILRGLRDPDRYDPRQRGFTGPWRMVKCKDGPYVDYDEHKEVVDYLRKNAEINPAQSPHDGIHTCSKGCNKPGCNRGLRETIEEQDAQIEALKQDLLEQTAAVRHLRMERVHDLNHIGGQQEEIAALRSQFANSEQENARLKADIKDLREDRIRMCDVTIEDIAVIARLKAEVERLTEKVRKIAEQVTKERKSVEEWHGRMTDDYNNPNGSASSASLQAWEKAEELLKDFTAKEGKPSV